MIRHFLLTCLLFISLSGCSQCNIEQGLYESSGGNETSTQLRLMQNKSFTILHQSWQAGHYEERETRRLTGIWTCDDRFLILIINDNHYKLQITAAGNNPLGISPDTQVLQFGDDIAGVYDYLANESLYRVE